MSKKLPALHFYPGDWWKDTGVQMLDHFHKGLWFELLLIMFDSEERGKLVIKGKQMPSKMLAKRLALSEQELESALVVLLDNGVIRREEDTGIYYNLRMMRDEALRLSKIKAGQKGGLAKSANSSATPSLPSKDPSNTLAASEDESESEDEIEDLDPKKEEVPDPPSHSYPGKLALDDFQREAALKALLDNGFKTEELARRIFILEGYYARNPHKYRKEVLIYDLCSPMTTKLMLDEKAAKIRVEKAGGFAETADEKAERRKKFLEMTS